MKLPLTINNKHLLNLTLQNNLLVNQDKNIVEMCKKDKNLITFQEFSDKTTANKNRKEKNFQAEKAISIPTVLG